MSRSRRKATGPCRAIPPGVMAPAIRKNSPMNQAWLKAQKIDRRIDDGASLVRIS